jgi:hypothetical protein
MKKFLLPVFAVSALLLSSCSTQQLARQAQSDDDVYYTEAKAKVIEVPVARTAETTREKTFRTDEQLYRDNNNTSDWYYDDYSYSTRLNRFYYNSPFRPYYDYRYSYGYNPWYTYSYDPFFYDPWFYRPGVSVWVGNYGSRYYNYNYYGHYGSRYDNGFWGPYSYYNMYPGYGYGYNNGRYYGNSGGVGFDNPSPGRARPNREGGIGRADNSIDNSGGGTNVPVTGRPSRGSYIPNQDKQSPGRVSSDPGSSGTSDQPASRPERAREERPSRSNGTGTSSTPAQTQQDQGNARPARPERTYTPPPSYDPPSRGSYGGSSSGGSSSGRSSSGSSDSGSSGSSSGGGRPSRGGR